MDAIPAPTTEVLTSPSIVALDADMVGISWLDIVRFCGTGERLKVPVGTEIEFAAAGGGVVASLAAPSAVDSDFFGDDDVMRLG